MTQIRFNVRGRTKYFVALDDQGFEESKHPRVKGGEKGGQFAPKGGGGGGGTGGAEIAEKVGAGSLGGEGGAPKSKKQIIGSLLSSGQGVTTAEVLKATGWPTVSMPQQAKALGLQLMKYKEGGVTKYKGVPMTPEAIAEQKTAQKEAVKTAAELHAEAEKLMKAAINEPDVKKSAELEKQGHAAMLKEQAVLKESGVPIEPPKNYGEYLKAYEAAAKSGNAYVAENLAKWNPDWAAMQAHAALETAKKQSTPAAEPVIVSQVIGKKLLENVGGSANLSKLDPLNMGKEKIKAAVQVGASPDDVEKVMNTPEKQAIAKQYGSIAAAHAKGVQYNKAAQNQLQQQQAAEAASKKEAEAFAATMNDPAAKAHYEVLSSIMGGGSKAQDYLNHAKSKIKSAGLEGKIAPAEAAQIIAYSGSHYAGVNKQLRSGVMTEQQYAYAKALNSALDKLPPHVGVTLRGTSVEDSNIAKMYQPGMIIEERGFTSTGKGSKFSGNMTFEIHGKTGRDISKLSSHPGENEVLFKSGSRFKVIKRAGNHIVMHEVDYAHG